MSRVMDGSIVDLVNDRETEIDPMEALSAFKERRSRSQQLTELEEVIRNNEWAAQHPTSAKGKQFIEVAGGSLKALRQRIETLKSKKEQLMPTDLVFTASVRTPESKRWKKRAKRGQYLR